MRAFITGGRGFVGRWLTEHLESCGDEVVAVDAETDVTDPDAIGRAIASAAPDAVYHLAARTHVGESWHDPLEVLRVNVLGTAAVLGAVRVGAPDAAVIVISSAEVYGIAGAADLPLTETAPVIPATPYAASKAAAEQVALQAWRGFGQRVVVVRPFNHVGPGQAPTFAVPGLARRVAEAAASGGRTLRVGTVSTERDFTDVRDVVRAYRLLALDGAAGGVYNICSGRAVSIESVARRLMALCGVELVLEPDPELVRPVDIPLLVGDPGRLVAATGWQPVYTLDQTLQAVLDEVSPSPSAAPPGG